MYREKYIKYKAKYTDLYKKTYSKQYGGSDYPRPCPQPEEDKNTRIKQNTLAWINQLSQILPELKSIDKTKHLLKENELYDIFKNIKNESLRTQLNKQFFNVARVCESSDCKKPLGPSLQSCNKCKTKQTKLLISDNISSNLVSLLYRLSYNDRSLLKDTCNELYLSNPILYDSDCIETEDNTDIAFMTYSDILDLSIVHLNAIPMNTWCPNITYLFKYPYSGIKLIKNLYHACQQSALQIIRKISGIDIKSIPGKFLAVGFNFPPSENQLHLQFLVMPMKIGEYELLKEDSETHLSIHFTQYRFIFYKYILRALIKATTITGEEREQNDNYKILAGLSDTDKLPTKGKKISPIDAQTYFINYFEAMGNFVESPISQVNSYIFYHRKKLRQLLKRGNPQNVDKPWYTKPYEDDKFTKPNQLSYKIGPFRTMSDINIFPKPGIFREFPVEGRYPKLEPNDTRHKIPDFVLTTLVTAYNKAYAT